MTHTACAQDDSRGLLHLVARLYDRGGQHVFRHVVRELRGGGAGIEVDDGEGGKRKVTPLIETKRGIGYMIREPKN